VNLMLAIGALLLVCAAAYVHKRRRDERAAREAAERGVGTRT
jgi:hypothetical protein